MSAKDIRLRAGLVCKMWYIFWPVREISLGEEEEQQQPR